MDQFTAQYHLPGLFEFYALYRLFLPLFFEHREYFYDWCGIGSIYGAPEGCLWGGGRVSCGDCDPRDALALLRDYGISARLTFSNSLLRPEHLADPRCNALCRLFESSGENGIIVHSDLLVDHLRQHYPGLYLVSSTTKVLTDFSAFRQELARPEFRYVVPDFRLNPALEQLRAAILSGEVTTLPTLEELGDRICRVAARESLPSLRPVINATGVILHTNLGRGCLSDRAADAVYDIARGYSTLEYNVEAGHRGSRHDHVEKLLCRLTGAESAMVVNNNAAAVMLILSTLAQGGEVITSRGELVEIGGSFRVPDIMELCGCHLREVGTTNKTHLSDYERAIGEQTRALLKVHTSNYRIVGFTESLPLSDIVALGCRTGLPVVEDLGSGSLVDLEHYGIHDEPTVQNSIRAGVDVVSFSGDKLLGGPQAGIILGKKPYIDRMKRHPLARAIRVDKMTIAALWATLTTYQDLHRAEQEIPTLAMLAVSGEDLRASAAQLCALLKERGVAAEVVAQSGPVGGGSVPTQLLPTFAVALPADKLSPNQAEQALRCREKPIIGRITEGRLLLDVRTIFPEDMEYIADTAAEVLA